jgi:two-component system phosphate regulon response regulator PhoB
MSSAAAPKIEDAVSDRILVVDDEPDIAALVAYHLAKHGYRVSTASDGAEAIATVVDERPDLVVLDLMLPRRSGFEVLEELRQRPETQHVGVILLTARTERADRLRGLSLGADDYLAKPFAPEELVLRVGAVLRRLRAPAVAAASVLIAGPLRIDPEAHRASVDGVDLILTATEFRLLLTLVERRGRVQSRSRLLQDVWNASPEIQSRTVDMHVQRLRQKLGPVADLIETVRGVGYRFRR